jgi:phosphate-selective porin OprO and OprP
MDSMRALITLLIALAVASPAAAQHPSVSAGKWLRLEFRARLQGDLRRSQVSTERIDDEDVARRRVGIEGRVAGIFDYQLEYEIGDRQWRDAYVDYRQFKVLQVQVGVFKLPFGLDENTSATSLDFLYRARISSRLAPGRDQGVSAHGKLLRDRLNYSAGLFRHDGANARPSHSLRVFGGPTGAARIVVQPFRGASSAAGSLHVGGAIASSNVPQGFPGIRARTVFGASFFDSDVWVKGRRLRTGVEAKWRVRRASLQSEYIRLTDERRGQSVEDGDLSPLVAQGWYISGTYTLIGKRKRYGSVELAGRYETLSFGSATRGELSTSERADAVLGNRERAMTSGVNWYVNRWVKVQANLIREDIKHPTMGPMPTRSAFWSRALRLQLAI